MHPSQNIPKKRILLIRQILKRQLIPQILIHIHSISPPILPPQHHIQRRRRRNRNAVTDDQPLP